MVVDDKNPHERSFPIVRFSPQSRSNPGREGPEPASTIARRNRRI